MQRKTRRWTEAQRKERSEQMKARKPWLKSAGPRTAEGKAIVSQNALKSGLYAAEIRGLRKVLAQQKTYIKSLMAHLK